MPLEKNLKGYLPLKTRTPFYVEKRGVLAFFSRLKFLSVFCDLAPIIVSKFVSNSLNLLKFSALCGDGRTRTAVQTLSQTAFYTFILSLVFDRTVPKDRPSAAYPLKT